MAIVVGENSYVTEAEFTTYLSERGYSLSGNFTNQVLLVRAMDWLEIQSFKGQKCEEFQDLEHPRTPKQYGDVYCETPDDVKNAQMIAARLIDEGNDLTPVVERAVKKEKVDVLEVEYMDNASSSNAYPELTRVLSKYLNSTGTSFRVTNG